ncbi:MAG: HIT family protein [Burkholderiales bacterium]|nr:HIT family protein [Burkholderiales bacterium]
MVTGCELCEGDGGELIVRREKWRVVRVPGGDGAAYPGFCRVVWNAHIKELTDLNASDRQNFMEAVFTLETVLRKTLQPEKMNVASLGNLTPHLHWHVIPRYRNDPAFPKPVWAIAAPPGPSLDTLIDKQAGTCVHDQQEWVSAVKRAFAAN